MYDPLLDHIRKFVSLNNAEAEWLQTNLKHRQLKKKEWILKEGQVCTSNHFILKGCLRLYFVTEQGTEQIIQFGIDNWWLTDYRSLDFNQPSSFHIQAVEPTEIAILGKQVQEEVFERLPQLERYFRIITQRAYAAAIFRIHYIYSQSGEERYQHFIQLFPDFVQRIPQYMLASYLGFTPEFLSKIRGKNSGSIS